jgi:hypothetical protein
MYKIRINCTSEEQLSFDDNKITKYIYDRIHIVLQPDNIDYINDIIILHKNNVDFTLKSLEFICKININEEQFIKFIEHMKNIGFYSDSNSNIQFIDNIGNIIFNYKFNSIEKKSPIQNKLNKSNKHKKNKSNYSQQYLYKKLI